MNIDIDFSFVSNNWVLTSNFSEAISNNSILYVYVNDKRFSYQNVASGSTTCQTVLSGIDKGKVYVKLYCNSSIYGPSNSKLIPYSFDNTALSNSFLKDIFVLEGDFINSWVSNVFDKVKNGRILPSYVKRSSSSSTDDDFNSFWLSIIKLFSLYVSYAKNLSKLWLNIVLLKEFLRDRFYFKNNLTLLELQDNSKNIYKISKYRSSLNQLSIDEGLNENSELYNYLNLDYFNDFIAIHHGQRESSWVINKSSPLWRGISTFEFNKCLTLDKLSIVGNITEVVEYGKKVWKLNSSNYFGFNELSEKIKVDHSINYSFSFFAKTSSQISVKVFFYDADNNQLDLPIKIHNGSKSDTFINNYSLPSSNRFHFFKFFIFSSDFQNTNLIDKNGQTNLRFFEGVEKIVIYIKPSSGNLDIRDFYFGPLNTPYSRGFIQSSNLVSIWSPSTPIDNLQNVKNTLSRIFFPYHYYLLFSKLKGLNTQNYPCLGSQTPNMVLSGRLRCQIVDGLKTGLVEEEFIDSNPCTNYPSEWSLSTQELNCVTCQDSGQNVGSFVENRYFSPFFEDDGKIYKTKTTNRISDGNCGYINEVVYSNEIVLNSNFRDILPKWENVGLPYCESLPICSNVSINLSSISVEFSQCETNIFGYVSFVDEKIENIFSVSLLEIQIQ